ncbi:MAG TPA: FCD domain-containing protein [Glaciihabitans sp.]|jgi:DNA-binding FadR family transcriptional regulator|nr:FCD domain-containing protein [Glaciihabitans sp.]
MTPSPTVSPTAHRAWELVLQRIETDLLEGTLVPGDHLPPERTLATDLGVGRSSVREAYRVLEVLGLIRTQTGSGPQSGAIIIARPSGGMSTLMRYQVAAHGYPVADVVKTRLVLEAAVVSELVSSDAPELAEATQILDTMDSRTAELSPSDFLALDAAFHLALAVASGNTVIASMMAGLRSSVESYVLAGVPALPSWDDTAARLRQEHRDILSAINAGNASLAASAISHHISGYYQEINFPSGQ